ncbi:hypothetical protein [Burkholderia gladioli]|nr:hypothetical protein [Burkholderia gladioli]
MGGLVIASLVLLPAFAHTAGAVVVVVLVWGVAYGAIPLGLSVWMQSTLPGQAEAASALFVSAVQTAIAAGAVAGGVAFDCVGAAGAMHLGVLLCAAGLAVLATFGTPRRAVAVLPQE